MTTNSNVPTIVFGPNGFQVPAVSDILSGALADFNAAFGGGLNTSLATPQGQLAMMLAAAIDAENEVFLEMAQGVDPAFATGRMQDAIGRIYFLTRQPGAPTVVTATCVGGAGVTIPAFSQAQAVDGNIYVTTEDTIIPESGSIDVVFQCITNGPIPCPAGALNQIYKAVPGWDTVSNAASGREGRNVESASEFEQRRAESVAQNARNTNSAIRGSLLSLPGVVDAFVYSNDTNADVVYGGVDITANSLYCCVAGGDAQTIANTIWTKKPPGIPTVGTTAAVVEDANSGYTPPLPTYDINFTVAAQLDLYVAVSLVNSTGVPSSALGMIKAAIAAAQSGGDGGHPFRIGGTVYASRFYAGIAKLGAWAEIVSITVGTAPAPVGNSQAVNIDHIANIPAANITLTLV